MLQLPDVITVDFIDYLITNGNTDYVLIDVRDRTECTLYGMIPTAKNIPLKEFDRELMLAPEAFEEKHGVRIDKTTPLILYCRSGRRSAIATNFAVSNGFNARNYRGSALEYSLSHPNVKSY